jgi:hypothetical protein
MQRDNRIAITAAALLFFPPHVVIVGEIPLREEDSSQRAINILN